jgi:hypothetical protein
MVFRCCLIWHNFSDVLKRLSVSVDPFSAHGWEPAHFSFFNLFWKDLISIFARCCCNNVPKVLRTFAVYPPAGEGVLVEMRYSLVKNMSCKQKASEHQQIPSFHFIMGRGGGGHRMWFIFHWFSFKSGLSKITHWILVMKMPFSIIKKQTIASHRTSKKQELKWKFRQNTFALKSTANKANKALS